MHKFSPIWPGLRFRTLITSPFVYQGSSLIAGIFRIPFRSTACKLSVKFPKSAIDFTVTQSQFPYDAIVQAQQNARIVKNPVNNFGDASALGRKKAKEGVPLGGDREKDRTKFVCVRRASPTNWLRKSVERNPSEGKCWQ